MKHDLPDKSRVTSRRPPCDPKELLKYLNSRFQFAGDVSSVMGGDETRRLPLLCPEHGAFSSRLCVIRGHFSRGQGNLSCPKCSRLAHSEQSARTRLSATQLGAAPPGILKSVQRLSNQGVVFDWSQYRGYNYPWSALCPTHGQFHIGKAGELLKRRISCPTCAGVLREQEHFERRLPYILHFAQDSASQVAGGWLYQIVDAGSSRRYWGITKTTVEARWRRHLHDAARGVKGVLYGAMRERPEDFGVESVAYFFTQAALTSAEKTRIREENSLWPLGYNASAGGQIGAPKAPSLIQRALADCENEDDFALLSNYRTLMARNGLDLQCVKRRVSTGMTVLQALNLPAAPKAPHSVTIRGVTYPTIAAAKKALSVPASLVTLGHQKKLNFSELFETYLTVLAWFDPSRPFCGHKVNNWEDAYQLSGFTAISLTYTMVRAGFKCPQTALESMAKGSGIIHRLPEGAVRLYRSARRACQANGIAVHKLETLMSRRLSLTRQQAFDQLIGATSGK